MSVTQWIEDHLTETEELLKALCAIPAPSHEEDLRAEFCRDRFAEAGFSNATIDGAKNAIALLEGEDPEEIVVFSAHTDTVFPDTTPFVPEERGRILYCPGAGDDTANLALLLMAARYFKEQGKTPKHTLLFAANTCEEGLGNLKGTKEIVNTYGDRIREMISFDLDTQNVFVTAVGSMRYRITLTTRGGHSFGDFGARSAIHGMAALICDLCAQPLPEKEHTKTTYNVGTICGGTSVNTIAEQAEILYEFRSDDNECLGFMEKNLQDILQKHTSEEQQIYCQCIGVRPGMSPSKDPRRSEDLIRRVETILQSVTGKQPTRTSGSTDSNIPLSLGIPAACFGLIRTGGTHTRGEWVDLDSLPQGLEIILRFLQTYF